MVDNLFILINKKATKLYLIVESIKFILWSKFVSILFCIRMKRYSSNLTKTNDVCNAKHKYLGKMRCNGMKVKLIPINSSKWWKLFTSTMRTKDWNGKGNKRNKWCNSLSFSILLQMPSGFLLFTWGVPKSNYIF